MSRKMKSGYEMKDRVKDAEGWGGRGAVEGARKRALLDNSIGEKF